MGRAGEERSKSRQRTWNQTLQGRVPWSIAGTLACPSIIKLEGKAQKQQCWAAWPHGHGVAFRESNFFIRPMGIAIISVPKRVLRDQVRELMEALGWAGGQRRHSDSLTGLQAKSSGRRRLAVWEPSLPGSCTWAIKHLAFSLLICNCFTGFAVIVHRGEACPKRQCTNFFLPWSPGSCCPHYGSLCPLQPRCPPYHACHWREASARASSPRIKTARKRIKTTSGGHQELRL